MSGKHGHDKARCGQDNRWFGADTCECICGCGYLALGHFFDKPLCRHCARARVRLWSEDQRVCRVCGFRRINVRHEPDPDHAPEGPDFYRALLNKLHQFQPG